MDESRTCCFTGHRPDKLPWGLNEGDPRCAALKASLARALEGLYRRGFRHFISGMAMGCDLYFAQGALELRTRLPDVTVEGAVPCPTQASRWPEPLRRRWRAILDACDLETVVQQNYDRFCMLRRDRYMVDRSAAVLAVFNGTPGGTQYTLNYAMDQGREILLLDPARPAADAVRLTL
ncbi:MAG: DUF1273 domain-containing protein [Oscillospiraceae bacterium]|nr:DUF1273 domain-containing protein [Oscillospiraceae bacterium]